MAKKYTKLLLVSANVGSIFEDPDRMLKIWMNQFLKAVRELDPEMLAVHCQEVGGKNYEESMQYVNQFVKTMLASDEMQQFTKARIFLDEDFTAVDKFTALGSLYFIHQSLHNVQIFDFHERKFVPVEGREVLSGNIENVPIKEKAKFPQDFFPDCKWSRKGFVRTRWLVSNNIFDLVNIHLFHDASNIVAMETTPSIYSYNRHRALAYTIDRFNTDEFGRVPYFIFGDFNFRLDTYLLVKKLTDQTNSHETKGKKDEVSKIVYTAHNNGKTILTVEKKGFEHHNHHDIFFTNSAKLLKEYDTELRPFLDRLHEYKISFPPSYPFSEDTNNGQGYMPTRCPAWCDRILMNNSAKNLLFRDDDLSEDPEYKMIGLNVCMGDHKPIYVNFRLRHGTVAGQHQVLPRDEEFTAPHTQVKITQVDTTKYIHVRQNGTSVRVFRETSV